MPAPNTDRMEQARVWFQAGTSEEFVALYATLAAQLDDERGELLHRLLSLCESLAHDRAMDAIYDQVDSLARHFPAFGPAILAVGRHLLDSGDRESCGVRVVGVQAQLEPDVHWAECRGFVPIEERRPLRAG